MLWIWRLGSFFTFLIFFGLVSWALPFPQDRVEINLVDKEVKFVDFCLGDYRINGFFSFLWGEENGSLIIRLEGKDITFTSLHPRSVRRFTSLDKSAFREVSSKGRFWLFPEGKNIAWLKLSLEKRGNVIFLNYLSWPQFIVKGDIDLKEEKLSLTFDGDWVEESEVLGGNLRLRAKVWGKISDFLVSGYLTVENGRYKGREFSRLRLDLLGKPPLLNIIDSELVLKDGTVAAIAGDKVLDLRNFSNLIPGVEFTLQKVFIGEWQVFSEDEERVGLRKNVDEKLDVFLKAEEKKDSSRPETELRYNLKDDKFLGFKMEESQTILRFERRRDF